jgi:hypothetical protein
MTKVKQTAPFFTAQEVNATVHSRKVEMSNTEVQKNYINRR